jgi:predicted aspartyl protease
VVYQEERKLDLASDYMEVFGSVKGRRKHLIVLFGATLVLLGAASRQAGGQTGMTVHRPAQAPLSIRYFDAGMQFLQKKDYKKALAYFTQTLIEDPYNTNAMYYQALCLQHIGDKKNSIIGYARLVSQFPNSSVGPLATKGLMELDPSYCRQLLKGPTQAPPSIKPGVTSSIMSYGSVPSDIDKLPSQTRVDFVRRDGRSQLLMVEGRLNGRDLRFLFDTGASDCCVGKNTLRELGIPLPKGEPNVQVAGVGSTGTTPAWLMDLNIQVGSISRRIPALVLEYRDDPLLGQTFFRDFAYTIDTNIGDSDRGTIVFNKRKGGSGGVAGAAAGGGGAGQSSGRDSVPFQQLDSKHLLVAVDIAGHKTKMYFDTGASGIVFTRDQLKLLNITIPEDATPIRNSGVAGDTTGVTFAVSRVSMGPIDKFDMPVAVVDSASMNYPLLGQAFFHDWKFTIDYDNKVINFQKR